MVEEIVLNVNFPRSILYSINNVHRYFERLNTERKNSGFEKVDFMIGRIKSRVKYSTVDSILDQGLHTYLSSIREELQQVAVAINQHYFAYT